MNKEIPALEEYAALLDEAIAELRGERPRSELTPGEVPTEILLAALERQMEREASQIREYLEALSDHQRAWAVKVATARVHAKAERNRDQLLGELARTEQARAIADEEAAKTRTEKLRDSLGQDGVPPADRIKRIARLRTLKAALKEGKR